MKFLSRFRAFWLVVSIAVPALAGTHPWVADPKIGAAELDQQWPLIEHPNDTVGIRGVFRFALEAAGLNWHPERIEAALALARSMQDLDPASKTFGNFRWQRGQAGVFDPNAVEFSMVQATLLKRRYAASLQPAGVRLLDALIASGIEGMRRHVVKVQYTNMYLLKTNNLIAAGETLGRPEVAAEGYRQLDTWLAYTASYGIGEYGAVTYYGVDLDPLGLMAKYADRPDTRAKAEAALRYLWTDIAANWWAPGDRLGGTNARSYDYLYGRGYLEAHTWPAGWLRERPELEGAGWLGVQYRKDLVTFYRDCSWMPPEELTEPIRRQVPRIVVQRWGTDAVQRAVNYVGRSFSLASSGASTARDERTLVGNIGDSPLVPQLALFMDGRGDPYGTKKEAEKQGAMKALHLTPFVASVQRGAELIQLLSDDPLAPGSRYHRGDLRCFLSQLIFARQAVVWCGEARIDPGTPEHPAELPAGAPVFLRLGDAAIGVRYLIADTSQGGAAPIQFIADQADDPARRITVVHAAGEPNGRATLAVWLRGAEGLDERGFAAFRKRFAEAAVSVQRTGGRISIVATGEHGPLGVEVDVDHHRRLELTGGEPDAVLSVNGRDLGRQLLAPYVGPAADTPPSQDQHSR